MFDTLNLGAFVVAGLLLNITPGADMLYIGSTSATRGMKAGMIAALGVGTGCLAHIFFAAFGLSVLLATSAMAFTIVKMAGAVYLVYLGLTTFWSLRKVVPTTIAQAAVSPIAFKQIFYQAVLINVLNPKVALFFMAFLPQFVAPGANHPAISFLFLGALFNINGTIINLLFASGAAKMAGTLKRYSLLGRLLKSTVGALFIGLGVRLALTVEK